MYPKFIYFATKSLSILRIFGPFKLLQYTSKIFNPETPKYVAKPRNIAYQSRWKVWKIDGDNQEYKFFNGTGFVADYVKM